MSKPYCAFSEFLSHRLVKDNESCLKSLRLGIVCFTATNQTGMKQHDFLQILYINKYRKFCFILYALHPRDMNFFFKIWNLYLIKRNIGI